MSRIWAALPLLEPLDQNAPNIPPNACWWRHPLLKGPDDHELIVRTDTTTPSKPARLGCWEWFDGLETQLILGVDVFRVELHYDVAWIYVLAVDVPTQSPAWQNVTEPGNWNLPVNGFTIPTYTFTAYPHTVSLRPAGG